MTDITNELLAAHKADAPTGRTITRRVVWVVAILAIIGLAIVGEINLSMAESAPQQAAAAAMSCFRLVVVYAFARGVDAICR